MDAPRVQNFPELDEAVAVGAVTPTSIRLWMRAPKPGRYRIDLWEDGSPHAATTAYYTAEGGEQRDHTYAFNVPGDCEDARPLTPLTRYRFRVFRPDGAQLGEGRFDTFPATPEQTPRRFRFAFGSCHQPFDEDGTVHPKSLAMLRAARETIEREDIKFQLWVGDQLYADFPESLSFFRPEVFRAYGPKSRASIFDCDPDEIRRIYQRRYRWSWHMPEWQALHASAPSFPLMDDHEVVDNLGSVEEHHNARFDCVRTGAFAAYRDYQQSRIGWDIPAGGWDYQFDYGAIPFYVLDSRSQRRGGADPHVFSEGQLEAFESWLESRAHAPVLFIVISVPPFFMPGWAAKLVTHVPHADFSQDGYDRWTHPQFNEERTRFLVILRGHQQRHPKQKVVVLSGDVHVGYAVRCDWRVKEKVCLYQLVSSPITHLMSTAQWHFARHVPRLHFWVPELPGPDARLHLMGGVTGRLRQPIADLNLGVVDVDLGSDDPRIRFRLVGVDDDQPKTLWDVEF